MNLVVIVSDTLRRDYLGCYGNAWVKTPNIDALAAESIVFDACYVGSFPTIPMRADLMTGKYVFHNVGWAPLQPGYVPFQNLLRANGRVTMMIADHTQFLAPGMNYHQGFTGVEWIRGQANDGWITDPIEFDPPCDLSKLRQPENWLERYMRNISRRRTEADWFSPQTFSKAVDWVEANRSHEKFMLYIDTFDVHEPWTPPQWYVDMYDPGYEGEKAIYPRYDRVGYLTEAELNHVRALYAATITMMDRWLGKFLDKLHDVGLWDKTAICFTSDHGWYHGEHGYIGKHTVLDRKAGWPFYDEVARTPCLLRIPGMEPRRDDTLIQPVDLMPTFCELCGVEAHADIHGTSVLPALNGGEPPRAIAVTSGLLGTDPSVRSYSTITDGRWTLLYAGENADAELYDTRSDPRQQENIIAGNPDVARGLHEQHMELLEQIGMEEERLRLRRAAPC